MFECVLCQSASHSFFVSFSIGSVVDSVQILFSRFGLFGLPMLCVIALLTQRRYWFS